MLTSRVKRNLSNATSLKRISRAFKESSLIIGNLSCTLDFRHENRRFFENANYSLRRKYYFSLKDICFWCLLAELKEWYWMRLVWSEYLEFSKSNYLSLLHQIILTVLLYTLILFEATVKVTYINISAYRPRCRLMCPSVFFEMT